MELVTDPYAPGWRRPPISRMDRIRDWQFAGTSFVLAMISFAFTRNISLHEDQANGTLSVLLLLAYCGAFAWRRSHPGVSLVAVSLLFIVLGELRVPEYLVTQVGLFLAIYSVGAWHHDRLRAHVVRIGVSTVMFIWLLINIFRLATDSEVLAELDNQTVGWGLSPLVAYSLLQLLTNVLYFAGAYYFGENAWRKAQVMADLELRNSMLQAQQLLLDEQAVSLERLRIARELHDSLAHQIALMGVHASAAKAQLHVDAAQTTSHLQVLEQAANNAVRELYGLVGTLRDTEAHSPTASLTLARLPDLVAHYRRQGLPVDLEIIGQAQPELPALTQLNLYRITQEALTNVHKHAADSSSVAVKLRYLPKITELEITNRGASFRTAPQRPTFGIAGMRERALASGGELIAQRIRDDAFLVRATVPVLPTLPAAGSAPAPSQQSRPTS